MTRRLKGAACSALFVICAAALGAKAQVKYLRGQNVAPAFEGWEQNPDGTYSMVFGYLNRNYEEQVDVPIGPDNTIDPGGDRGQPTHFYTRRQRFVFKIVVPKDWDKKQKVIWKLTVHGKTDEAKGWLEPEWELNDEVISENRAGGVLAAGNQPPSLTASSDQAINLGETLTLSASATDDGLPKPLPHRAASSADSAAIPDLPERRRQEGVVIKWIVYRAPGQVTFDQDSSPAVYGKPVSMTTKATFSTPGTYWLQAVASDGQLASTRDVKVTVNPTSTSARNKP